MPYHLLPFITVSLDRLPLINPLTIIIIVIYVVGPPYSPFSTYFRRSRTLSRPRRGRRRQLFTAHHASQQIAAGNSAARAAPSARSGAGAHARRAEGKEGAGAADAERK